jgi:hypothetical protein
MRVSGTGAPSRVAVSRKSAGGGSGTAFKVDTGEPARAQGATGLHSLAAIDALVALQEVPDATERRRRAVKRGEAMLDLLDDIKIALLSGGLARSRIIKLTRIVEDRGAEITDPELREVLAEIELRARVELAKLERAA